MGINRIIIKSNEEGGINFDFDFTKSSIIKVDWNIKYPFVASIPEFIYLNSLLHLLMYPNSAFYDSYIPVLKYVFVEIYYDEKKYQFSLNKKGEFFHEALFKIKNNDLQLLHLYPFEDQDGFISEEWTFRKISSYEIESILENTIYMDDNRDFTSYKKLSEKSIERIKKLVVYFGFDDIDDVVFYSGQFSHFHHKVGSLSFETESHGLKDLIHLLICVEGYDTIITPSLGYYHPNLREAIEEYLGKSGKHIIYAQ